jgi:hypothetical protein
VQRSYLASEAKWRVVRDMQLRNLIVPVVGDFAGPKAIRTVGAWLGGHGAIVSAFYLSNVEQYLFQQGDDWRHFYENVATLPLDSSSTFIRTISVGGGGGGFLRLPTALSSMPVMIKAYRAGTVGSYNDVILMSHQ